MLKCDRCKRETDTLFGVRVFVVHGDPKSNPQTAIRLPDTQRPAEICQPCVDDVTVVVQSDFPDEAP